MIITILQQDKVMDGCRWAWEIYRSHHVYIANFSPGLPMRMTPVEEIIEMLTSYPISLWAREPFNQRTDVMFAGTSR